MLHKEYLNAILYKAKRKEVSVMIYDKFHFFAIVNDISCSFEAVLKKFHWENARPPVASL